jgi:hypothetical protein
VVGEMLVVDTIARIRRAHFVDGKSIKQITREFDLHKSQSLRDKLRPGPDPHYRLVKIVLLFYTFVQARNVSVESSLCEIAVRPAEPVSCPIADIRPYIQR